MGVYSEKMDVSNDSKIENEDNGALGVLKSMSTMITTLGEISSKDHVLTLIKIMENADKLVKRCMCLNILHVTKNDDYLGMFISTGGWEVLYDWLSSAKKNLSSEIDDYSMMIVEILRVYERLPISVEDLKRNGCAKTIKSLSKAKNEEVKKLAFKIVNEWMLKVKSNQDNADKSHSKKHKKERRPSKENENHHDNNIIDVKTEDNHLSSNNNISINTSKVSRPKTAKTLPTKFRSTGLLEEIEPGQAKKRDDSLKRSHSDLKSLSLKRSKLNENHDSVVKPIIPENPKALKMIPIPEIYESSGFMDAISVQKRQSVLNHIGSGIGVKRARPKKITLNMNKKVATSPATSPAHNSSSFNKDDTKNIEKELDKSVSSPHQETSSPEEVKNEECILKNDGKKKRRVTWANDNTLKTYFYFELDENERVNVNRISFEEIRKQELQMEKNHMNDKKPNTDNWILKEIDFCETDFVRGSQSLEKDIQSDRENQVLKVLYFSKNMIPETASEPDYCSIEEYKEPKIIPCKTDDIIESKPIKENETRIDVKKVVDNFTLTPQMANLLKNINNENINGVSQHLMHQPMNSNMNNGNILPPNDFMPNMNHEKPRMQHNPLLMNMPRNMNLNMMHRNNPRFRGPNMNNRNAIRHNNGRNVCRNFLSQHGCRFGNNCNFFHPQH